MKWDVKHDRAKKVIDRFLDNAGYWQESEDLVTGLTDEEKELVNAEVELMIASIRKRYKLQERLPEQVAEAEKPAEKAVEEEIMDGYTLITMMQYIELTEERVSSHGKADGFEPKDVQGN